MEKVFTLKYNVVTRDLSITENDFTTFEALGVLEATKQMISKNWLEDGNNDQMR